MVTGMCMGKGGERWGIGKGLVMDEVEFRRPRVVVSDGDCGGGGLTEV